jgi:hypothetical protein
MIIVGYISTQEEAEEIAYIKKIFVIGNRARSLAENTRKE